MRLNKRLIVGAVTILAFVVGYALTDIINSPSQVVAPNEASSVVDDPIDLDPVQEQAFDARQLQTALDEYLKDVEGEYSVVVQDPVTKQVLAEHRPDELYFTASLYKLYIAFLAWQDIGDGSLVPENLFQGSRSTIECLDLMIRESDSPCGEAILAEYDYATAQKRLRDLGLPNINMPGFQVSASDMAALLQRIYSADGIIPEAEVAMRDAMQGQIYTKGLKSGFSGASVEDKVGFSSDGDWHDTGIVTLEDGRQLIVAVLSLGAGSDGVSGLAESLQQAF